MELLFNAQLVGLLITRDHYHDVRTRAPENFPGSLAAEMLEAVDEEINYMVEQIDLYQFY